MRWTSVEDPKERYGPAYWNARATTRWNESCHGAFGAPVAMAQAHRNLWRGLNAAKTNGQILPAKMNVLEIGCGYGASYDVVAEFFKTDLHLYVGTDCCVPYIEEARKRYPDRTWQVAEALNVEGANFDLVVTCATLTSLESIWPAVVQKAFASWLKPGGIMVVGEQTWYLVLEGAL